MTTETMEVVDKAEKTRLDKVVGKLDKDLYRAMNETLTFSEYLEKVYENPMLVQSAYQRLYRMIKFYGVEKFTRLNRTYTKYKFFSQGPDPVYGLEEKLEDLVKTLRGAASWYGTEKRIILLHGPVGSAKSTICRNMKRGLEAYSLTNEGALYTWDWVDVPEELDDQKVVPCPMHDDPIRLIPLSIRKDIEKELNEIWHERCEKDSETKRMYEDFPIRLDGELNPHCQFFLDRLLEKYNGDWETVINKHVRVKRCIISENRRVGIGTFQPKDEKNQDSTELTGDINYMKLGQLGKDSDPRSFNFDGEFEISHRGLLEFIEVLKLAPEFLYDLLGATQERSVKPKKFAQVDIDVALISHTNNPEYQRLQQNERMAALRDRTVRVDIPYTLRWKDEIAVLKKDYNPQKVRSHISPHTLEIAALWAILTRLSTNEKEMDIVTKAKMYDGQAIPGKSEDVLKEMRDRNPDEGMKHGISARYVQTKISNALVSNHEYINPFMVLHEIKEGLNSYSLISDAEAKAHYLKCVDLAKKELDERLKKEVQEALVADDQAIVRLFNNYLDNVYAYIEGTKIKHPFTQEEMEADERMMRSIEEKIDISEQLVDDFRRSIAAYIGKHARDNVQAGGSKENLKWDCNPRLAKALQLKLFEDTKDTIKLSALTTITEVIDPDLAEKIDAVKARLVRNFGYTDKSATDVLNYVASIFARGDVKDNG